MLSARLKRRLARHHMPLAAAMLTSCWALYATRDYSDVITRLSFASAWPALVLLAATLIIGPVRILAGNGPVLSVDLRRDVGIWAGIAGIFHAVIGQCVHLRGRPWLYYIYEKWRVMPLRYDMFGFANCTGLLAALVLAALLVTSNDYYLRRLGSSAWKSLQRWNYACFAFAAAHSFGYLAGIESPRPTFITVASVSVLATLLLQLLAWQRRI